MRVIVLGSGVVGVTTAYYLAKAGHEVTVIDRQPGPALETSFANAGQISPGYASPWAAPGIPLKAFKWLFQRHAPLAIQPGRHAVPAAVDVGDVPQLRRRPLRRQQGTHGAPGRVQPRLHRARCAATPASTTKAASRARCSCSAPRPSSTAPPRTSRCCSQAGVPFEVLGREQLAQRRTGAGQRARQAGRRPAPAERRNRRLPAVHHPPGRRWRASSACASSSTPPSTRLDIAGRPDHGRAHRQDGDACHGRPLRGGAGQLFAPAAAGPVLACRSTR